MRLVTHASSILLTVKGRMPGEATLRLSEGLSPVPVVVKPLHRVRARAAGVGLMPMQQTRPELRQVYLLRVKGVHDFVCEGFVEGLEAVV